jgi:ABC-type glutathione transport system ATPase component
VAKSAGSILLSSSIVALSQIVGSPDGQSTRSGRNGELAPRALCRSSHCGSKSEEQSGNGGSRMTEPIQPTLRISGIAKSFGASNAPTDVRFEVARGEVHALVGENRAGKSTLVKIITGILEPDAGEIALNGEVVRFATPIEARRAGFAAVYQDPGSFLTWTLPRTSVWARRP